MAQRSARLGEAPQTAMLLGPHKKAWRYSISGRTSIELFEQHVIGMLGMLSDMLLTQCLAWGAG